MAFLVFVPTFHLPWVMGLHESDSSFFVCIKNGVESTPEGHQITSERVVAASWSLGPAPADDLFGLVCDFIGCEVFSF